MNKSIAKLHEDLNAMFNAFTRLFLKIKLIRSQSTNKASRSVSDY